jgi:hypothetical protein
MPSEGGKYSSRGVIFLWKSCCLIIAIAYSYPQFTDRNECHLDHADVLGFSGRFIFPGGGSWPVVLDRKIAKHLNPPSNFLFAEEQRGQESISEEGCPEEGCPQEGGYQKGRPQEGGSEEGSGQESCPQEGSSEEGGSEEDGHQESCYQEGRPEEGREKGSRKEGRDQEVVRYLITA